MGNYHVRHKIEKWASVFDGSPEFRCDVRTMIVRVNKLNKRVDVEQQFWFHTVRVRSYKSQLAYSRARRLYKLISQGKVAADCGYRDTLTSGVLWFNVKVWG